MEKHINAFEINCMRVLLHYKIRDNKVRELMLKYIGEHDHMSTIVKRRQFTWFGHVIRCKGSLANTMLHGGTDG